MAKTGLSSRFDCAPSVYALIPSYSRASAVLITEASFCVDSLPACCAASAGRPANRATAAPERATPLANRASRRETVTDREDLIMSDNSWRLCSDVLLAVVAESDLRRCGPSY